MPRTLSMINFKGDVCGSYWDNGSAMQNAAAVDGATGSNATAGPTIIYTNPANSGKIAKITFDTVGRTSAALYDQTQDDRGTFPRHSGTNLTSSSEYPIFMIEAETWPGTGGDHDRTIIPVNVVAGASFYDSNDVIQVYNQTASELPDDSILIGCPWGDGNQVNSPYMQRTVYIGEGEMLTAMVAGSTIHSIASWRLHVRALVTEETM